MNVPEKKKTEKLAEATATKTGRWNRQTRLDKTKVNKREEAKHHDGTVLVLFPLYFQSHGINPFPLRYTPPHTFCIADLRRSEHRQVLLRGILNFTISRDTYMYIVQAKFHKNDKCACLTINKYTL